MYEGLTLGNESIAIEGLEKLADIRRLEDSLPRIVEDSLPRIVEDSLPRIVEDSLFRIVEDSLPRIVEDSLSRIVEDSLSRIGEDSLSRIEGVESFKVEKSLLSISYYPDIVHASAIRAEIEALGFRTGIKVKSRNPFKRFLDRLIESNEKTFSAELLCRV